MKNTNASRKLVVAAIDIEATAAYVLCIWPGAANRILKRCIQSELMTSVCAMLFALVHSLNIQNIQMFPS